MFVSGLDGIALSSVLSAGILEFFAVILKCIRMLSLLKLRVGVRGGIAPVALSRGAGTGSV